METIKKRISDLIEREGLTANSFSIKIGTSSVVIGNVVNGRNDPGYDTLIKILNTFKDVDGHWLLTGETFEGRMKPVKFMEERIEELEIELRLITENLKKISSDWAKSSAKTMEKGSSSDKRTGAKTK